MEEMNLSAPIKPRFNYFTYKNKVIEITDNFDALKVKLSPDEDTQTFSLIEVKTSELSVLRVMVKAPFIVIKKNNRYYITVEEVPFKFTFYGSTLCGLNHRCSSGPQKTGTCPRLLALPDEMGGCQKVFDYKLARLENYPWITFAAEAVNTNFPSFMILECEHHPRSKII